MKALDGEPERRFVEIVDPADGRTRWKLDAGFLLSNWRCIWGDGCQGIHDERRPELGDGCCSVGVVLADEEEAMTVAALAETMEPGLFQFAAEAADGGVLAPGAPWATRVVEGACVFLNRPGFSGGAGCALHLAALAEDDDPLDWKPRTCWKLPIKVEGPDGDATLRAWRRDDWGPGGATMAWWCTEAPEAFTADRPVIETLEPELRRILGDDLYDATRRELGA